MTGPGATDPGAFGAGGVEAVLHAPGVALPGLNTSSATGPVHRVADEGFAAPEPDAASVSPDGAQDGLDLGLGSAAVAFQANGSHQKLAAGTQSDLGEARSGRTGQIEASHRSRSDLQGGGQQHWGDQASSGTFTPVSGLAAGRVSTAHASIPPAVTEQVVAAVEAMSQSRSSSGRVTVSITPDELGRIGITVERQANGMTTIHVQAERLATLDLLRTDQAALVRALDQSGHGRDGHSLSFSWDNGGGHSGQGKAPWRLQDEPPGMSDGAVEPSRAAYPHARPSLTFSAAARGGVDVTA